MPRFTFASVLKMLGWLVLATIVGVVCQQLPPAFRH
jgi:hypothetical protein